MSITADIIKDTTVGEQRNYLGAMTYKQIDRTYMLDGVLAASGFPAAASEISASCLNAIKTIVPPTLPHNVDPLCVARNYTYSPTGSDTGGQVVVSFIFELQATYIEADAGLQQEMADYEFAMVGGVLTKKPIIVKYAPNKAIGPTGAVIGDNVGAWSRNGVVPVLRPTMGLTFSQTIYDFAQYKAILAARRQYLGFVNSTTFSGDPFYYWLCDGIKASMSPYSGNYTATIHMTYRVDSWAEWVRMEADRPLSNLWRYDGTGAENPNGYYKSSPYPMADLNALVGMLGIAVP